MDTEVLIVGGGIAGLTAAWRLGQSGIAYRLVEARPRLGGRIHSVPGHGGDLDLGPSWIWPGQPHVAGLLTCFGLSHFPQQSRGDIVHQRETGDAMRFGGESPTASAYRIRGGSSALTDAIAGALPAEAVFPAHRCHRLTRTESGIHVRLTTPEGELEWIVGTVALALPPRLAAKLDYEPALPAPLLEELVRMPTWMAAHAKIVAIYDRPFWREQGLSGTAMSRTGPLVEIHDASAAEGGPFALFGFVGHSAAARQEIGKQALLDRSGAQLVELFGPHAADPLELVLQDWSEEPLTADDRDRQPLGGHPHYGLVERPQGPWAGRLFFISTETARENGGLIEGAVAQAMRFAEDHAQGAKLREPSANAVRPAMSGRADPLASRRSD